MKKKIVVVEDEVRIREGIKKMLSFIDDTLVVGVAGSVKDAKEVIEETKPDIVLLDIHLSDGISFELFNQLTYRSFSTIFITAYDEYALKAIQLNAVHYLLKPIDIEDLEEAIHRASKQFNHEFIVENKPTKFVVNTREGSYIILFENLVRCEADEGYTTFYLDTGEKYMVAKPLKTYQELLPEDLFCRVHQSHLVNIHHVVSYTKSSLRLSDESEIPISVRRKTIVHERLNQLN